MDFLDEERDELFNHHTNFECGKMGHFWPFFLFVFLIKLTVKNVL